MSSGGKSQVVKFMASGQLTVIQGMDTYPGTERKWKSRIVTENQTVTIAFTRMVPWIGMAVIPHNLTKNFLSSELDIMTGN